MDGVVATNARHAVVHLSDDDARCLAGRTHVVARWAEAAIALVVGWGDLDHGHVDGQESATEEVGHLEEEAWQIVGAMGG